jgi:eukaryotic-like serine/threonine-protein kinase
MPSPATVDDLLKLIRKSGMIDEPRLAAYLERSRLNGPLTQDVRKLAGAMVKDGLLTYFQAEQFMLGKWRGFTIGKYKLLERIGFGGMGQVFLCEHMYMRRRVAIKVLPPAKAEEPAALGRFYREARAAAALDHPNIVRTHDIDQDGNLHFLVMEYVDGSSMLEVVKKKGSMAVGRATHYVWQAAHGLDHAYRVGVIHRDIKPGNVLIDRTGVSKILDMGLARFYHSDDDMLTKKYDEKSVLGTADYVAPEQTINSHDVDCRADIYSLGATFYFLLAGHPPFPDGTISQKLISHQTKEPVPIERHRPEIPRELAVVLRKMMAKLPNERYRTPAEVIEALQPLIPRHMELPPEDEMPVLSPAAREPSSTPAAVGSLAGALNQDSSVVKLEPTNGSPKSATAGGRRSAAGSLPVAAVAAGTQSHRAGTGHPRPGDASSGNMPPPYFEPPPVISPLGSAALPPVPNPTRPVNETARMAEATERAAAPRRGPRPMAIAVEMPEEKRGRLNPVVRIGIEAVAVFGVCLVLYFIFRNL